MEKKIAERKKIGVWLDHSKAYLLPAGKPAADIITIHSSTVGHLREKGEGSDTVLFSSPGGKGFHTSSNEYRKNKTKQNELKKYYEEIQQALTGYDQIMLIGPTTAKTELRHLMEQNHRFNNTKIELYTQDELTPNQLAAYINTAAEKD